MATSLQTIPNWSSRTLQGLAFWLGYQDACGIASHLSEGAIATEFLRLVSAHKSSEEIIEPEVMYRHIPELASKNAFRGCSLRADLVVARNKRMGRGVAYPAGSVEAIIEIKHGRSLSAKVYEDIDRLGKAVSNGEGLRGFLVYASVSRCRLFIDTKGTARGTKVWITNQGTKYKVRRVCRAVSRVVSRGREPAGHFTVLVEALC